MHELDTKCRMRTFESWYRRGYVQTKEGRFPSAGGASGNKASTWTRLATIALAVGMMAALATPAWGQSDDLTLRRDGSEAEPFVAQVGPQTAPTPSVESGGFHRGDAAIGAGLGAAAALLTVGGGDRRAPPQHRAGRERGSSPLTDRKGTGTQMHNPHLLVSKMVARQREHARLHRDDWKRPPEPKLPHLVRRAIAAARRLGRDE